MKTWSVEELRAFLSFVCTDRNAALYRTALMTGMRRGELLGLRHRDLDLANARLNVRQQWTKDGAHGRQQDLVAERPMLDGVPRNGMRHRSPQRGQRASRDGQGDEVDGQWLVQEPPKAGHVYTCPAERARSAL